ncbi:capsule biosynthesis protein [Paralimibaculum aggregatum]|uniref:Capsule biosynthesis protein n=1 Tax=Paralimibaculum aggregatum TaxID=3036245 RepID=A0ABQ6LBM1_9RHOB|nr:capsular biosynthesis protein [Limibaculum sp. NKW23]GMG80806.1 capsule biosynthesis protein [Limibaculum sp. NKW23]
MLLQGPASWFFLRLAAALRAEGAEVLRVLLCPGDRLFWRGPALRYRGRPEGWAGWIGARLAAERVSDLVCLGDGRFWHRAAIAQAEATGVRVHVVEQGYLRPGWLTLEPGGMGARSRIPRCPVRIRGFAGAVEAQRFAAPFASYAAMDVAWNLANLLGRPAWPRYRTHALHGPVADWAGWIGKALGAPLAARRVRAGMARALGAAGPVFLLPLQLETDFQIRRDGPPGGLAAVLDRVVADFAAHAPGNALLLVKRHPLDNGLALWARRVRRLAARHGVSGRVLYLAGGDLERLLASAAGVVTVNSTVGLGALQAGVPVIPLGAAVYDVPGMTHRGPLAGFWSAPQPPEDGLVAAFAAMLAATVQVPGGFDGSGAEPGARGVAARILAPAPF